MTELTKDLVSEIFLFGVVWFFPEFSLLLCFEFDLLDLSLAVVLLSLCVISLLPLFFSCDFFLFFSFVASPVVLFADVEGGADVEDDLSISPGVPRGLPVLLP